MKSPHWAAKRKKRLEIDGYRCRLCSRSFDLEVHHNPDSYPNIPHESVEDDLTTLCKRCHDLITSAIRADRYKSRNHTLVFVRKNVLTRKEVHHGLASFDIQTDFIGSAVVPQRADGRPDKQVVEVTKADFVKAGKDGRGL